LLLIDFSAISAISFFFFQHDFIVPFRLRSQGISEISLIFQCCCSATSFSLAEGNRLQVTSVTILPKC